MHRSWVRCFWCGAVGVVLYGLEAQAAIIADHFPVFANNGNTIGVAEIGGQTLMFERGNAFVGNGESLNTIELAVSLDTGTNALDVMLMSDDQGPDAIIESFTFTDTMGAFGQINPPLVATSVDRPVLDVGTIYWVVVSAGAVDTEALWLISESSRGLASGRTAGNPWFLDQDSELNALRVATVIPEPSSVALLAIGMVAILKPRKRYR